MAVRMGGSYDEKLQSEVDDDKAIDESAYFLMSSSQPIR